MQLSRTEILLHEYDALYKLAAFRMTSLDSRIPLIGGTVTAFLSSLVVLPRPAQAVLLFEVPAVLIWFLRTTATHACSFEDALRRIEEIEIAVNRLAESELLAFQSRHPSRGKVVGGRTGTETVVSTFAAALIMLASCGYLGVAVAAFQPILLQLYLLYLTATLVALMKALHNWRRYRYMKTFDLASRPP